MCIAWQGVNMAKWLNLANKFYNVIKKSRNLYLIYRNRAYMSDLYQSQVVNLHLHYPLLCHAVKNLVHRPLSSYKAYVY